MQHLHFSIGPVQGFVAQSRRTRDLWGSSYLLSFLAAHAMSGAREEGGVIIRPRIDDDPMLRWVESRGEGTPPSLGSLPNQFTVQLSDGQAASVANRAERELRAAWQRICRAVWERYVAPAAALGNSTEAIWKRQTEGFWELLWVAGAPEDHGLLARRKLWRTHALPEEAGNKCTVMPDLQEISGHVRATDRVRQDAFWDSVRAATGEPDLRDNERLCAIALVKRLYSRVPKAALGWSIAVAHWPSTVDIATAPWRIRVLGASPAEAEAFATAVLTATDNAFTGGGTSFVSDGAPEAPRFLRLDGNWLQRSFLASPILAPLSDQNTRQALLAKLDALSSTHGAPPIYFGLLLADGDQVGRLVASLGSEVVSKALASFAKAVPAIVSARYGVTIYAGGDDVLALLPLDGALDCARALEQAYRQAFGSASATLSAAVVFAHARDPLNRTLTEAHRLLDDVAKEQNRRASLAVGVYRGDAPAIQWVSTWERSSLAGTRKHAVDCLRSVIDELAPGTGALSSSLLQDLRLMLGRLCGLSPLAPGVFVKPVEGSELMPLLRSEIEHRLAHRDGTSEPSDSEQLASRIGDILGRSRNGETPSLSLGIDGLLLAGFLAGGGSEGEHGP